EFVKINKTLKEASGILEYIFWSNRMVDDLSGTEMNPDVTQVVCRASTVHVVKETALGLRNALLLLQDDSLNVKILHLVRDPRGILASRQAVPDDTGGPDYIHPDYWVQWENI
ncbi:unnamed protein product, partial [Meganyctiphanes norvegica]